MRGVTFARPDPTVFCRFDEPGLRAVGLRLGPDRAVIACRVVEPGQWCRRRGATAWGPSRWRSCTGPGGLDWRDVEPLIRRAFGAVPGVGVLLYPPGATPRA